MKMGTIASPWRYDAVALHAIQPDNLRRTAILRYASRAAVFPISRVIRLPVDGGPFDQSREWRMGQEQIKYSVAFHLLPITIESGPTSGSTRVSTKPASLSQPMQSAPVKSKPSRVSISMFRLIRSPNAFFLRSSSMIGS